ncbi:hypothetical protein R6Q57_003440 [Mikania cordata]
MAAGGDGLKEMLQSAVQSVQWTYIIFWKFCHKKRVLVWGDGCYNGPIKTRKTVAPVEFSTEEAAESRSEQLRELYDSLASGEQQVTENQQAVTRRPSVALSPEDLTEFEWFYLVCVSFTFPPGVGLVGDAYAKQQHQWLTGANEADSKVFTRTILAKTVICIPLLNGVVELGTTDKVEETIEFIQHLKLFFMKGKTSHIFPPHKPALSAHSSNTTLSSHQTPHAIKPLDNANDTMDENVENDDDDDDDDDDDEDDDKTDYEEEDAGDDEMEDIGDNEDENTPYIMKETCHISRFQGRNRNKSGEAKEIIETNELLQPGMSPDIKFGSPNDGSNNLATSLNDSYVAASTAPGWSDNFELHNPSNIQLHTSELAPEDSRYSHTVSAILHNQLTRWSDSSRHNSVYSIQSSFTTWTSKYSRQRLPATSQRILKYMVFTVPFLHSNASESVPSRLPKTTSDEDLSASHVLAERRRREKLNERFIILRTLVPLVTKMDKASILGDTIEYVKQLRKKIQDLEARCRSGKRKVRRSGGGGTGAVAVAVEVSIIENDALVEVQCGHRDGLLLDVMKKLRELGVEITTVHSCVEGGLFSAELRAKVKVRKANNGKKISITQVKKAIDQIISP